MRSNIVDITGGKFGMLTAVGPTEQRLNGQVAWNCLCDCGEEVVVRGFSLRKGHKKSCGCSLQKMRRKTREERGQIKHDLSLTDEYRIWNGMMQRCHNQSNSNYPNYGGRGIIVCERWRNDFLAFLEDIGKRPNKDHSIDRIDNDKGYSPDNCQWATIKEQMRNRRIVKMSVVKVSHLLMMHKSGEYTPLLLKNMFQISKSTCNRIISGKTWN